MLPACATYGLADAPRIVFDRGDAPTRGPREAPVEIVEFADFRCPHCARMAPELDRLLAAYPDQVTLAFVHMPVVAIDSGRAAMIAEAARVQGEFWGMHDALFARVGQPVEEEPYRQVAQGLGMDPDRFSEDLRNGALLERVRADATSADALGIEFTPTLLVNGRLVLGFQPFDELRDLVEQELRAAR